MSTEPRPIRFKVWLELETEYDDDTYRGDDMPDCLGAFDTETEAHAFISDLVKTYAPEMITTSDHCEAARTGGAP